MHLVAPVGHETSLTFLLLDKAEGQPKYSSSVPTLQEAGAPAESDEYSDGAGSDGGNGAGTDGAGVGDESADGNGAGADGAGVGDGNGAGADGAGDGAVVVVGASVGVSPGQ
eukprot:gnl/MRDRNA2_/MRDRNA2_381494_c0_seq1.p3 gnl/MRDRNA2_/MRDRNA2_381494_c0~~gnl/MRDRNA2_/MRDRNA2_381494_c0_seq1.p3  ORF type:complete len:112 (-),score=29.19 gnl/MRDRNA2_/MRDRNA2_381494_c0_seq1:7-342(-)